MTSSWRRVLGSARTGWQKTQPVRAAAGRAVAVGKAAVVVGGAAHAVQGAAAQQQQNEQWRDVEEQRIEQRIPRLEADLDAENARSLTPVEDRRDEMFAPPKSSARTAAARQAVADASRARTRSRER